MITLLTGQPGNGKTSWIINRIKEDLAAGKTVYTCGIMQLDLPVIPLTKRQLSRWHETDPVYDEDGNVIEFDDIDFDDPSQIPKLSNIVQDSVIYADEAQKNGFAPTGSNIPLHVARLDTHRHFGLDFTFITQFPNLIHSVAKGLVTHHFHIRFTWAGRRIHEWPEWQNDPKSKAALEVATSKKYKIDPTTFKHYHSATKHVKHSHSTPVKFYLFMAFVIITPFLIYKSYDRIMQRTNPEPKKQGSIVKDQSRSDNALKDPKPIQTATSNAVDQSLKNNDKFSPYELPDFIDWSVVASCVSSASRCKCYDFNGTTLTLPETLCRKATINGWQRPKKRDQNFDTLNS